MYTYMYVNVLAHNYLIFLMNKVIHSTADLITLAGAFLTQAAMNVGGIVLNALAIEHFILRHPSDSIQVSRHTHTHIYT